MTDWQEPAIYAPRCNRIHHRLHQELYRDAIANMSGDSTTMEYTIPDSSQFFSSTYEFDYDKYRKVFACDEYDFEDQVAKYTVSEFTSHLGRSV